MSGVMESVTGELREFGGIVVPLIEAKTDDKGTIPIKIIDPGWAHRATTPARSCSRR